MSGLGQSIVAPSASFLVGFEIDKQVQLAVGPNRSAFDPSGEGHNPHLVAAVGTTVDTGIFSVPIHLSYIPDVKWFNRYALKTGFNW